MMRTDGDKQNRVGINQFVMNPQIAGDIQTAVFRVFALQAVIIEQGMKWVAEKQIASFFELSFFAGLEFPILFLEIPMEENLHRLGSAPN